MGWWGHLGERVSPICDFRPIIEGRCPVGSILTKLLVLQRGNTKLLVLQRSNTKHLAVSRNNTKQLMLSRSTTKQLVLSRSNTKQLVFLRDNNKFRCYRVITLNY
jgi:hypothetical protein